MKSVVLAGLALGAFMFSVANAADDAQSRAAATVAQMKPEEMTVLTHGIMPIPLPGVKMPKGVMPATGYVPGIPRLNIPPLVGAGASLGVEWIGGLRGNGATALPSGMAMAASWNPALFEEAGAMIGREARAKGINVMLAGAVNLMRDPRNGRTFEYLGEDPLLAGMLVGAQIRGEQSNHMIATIKHYALNDEETARTFGNAIISDAAARESDLLAFEIGIEQGNPGSVMCSYNKINGAYGCDNDVLLNKILKGDWGYKGFVMSDWGAVHSLVSVMHGLDQQSGEELDPEVFLDKPLAKAAAKNPAMAARLKDMNQRIVRAIYAYGLDKPDTPPAIDREANAAIAQRVAEQGIVLLRNRDGILPLATTAKKIAVIGGYADTGVLSGGGSSQVARDEGPYHFIPLGGGGVLGNYYGQLYNGSPPLEAMKARAPQTKFIYRYGHYVTDAVQAAKDADVAIVFATQWQSEGLDVPDLHLPDGQDALIAAVAEANPHTIVVLENGGPVLMPWLEKTAAVVEAWYPGVRGGEAIARVLYGDVNPSGRLAGTFPANIEQLPRPKLPGSDTIEYDTPLFSAPDQKLDVDYDIEGANVGYRWYAARNLKPLFPFGYGLSYTSFREDGLKVDGQKLTATAQVANVGKIAGADVAQLYLLDAAGKQLKRLVGFQRVELQPGESKDIGFVLDPRLLGHWNGKGWTVKSGQYRFALGRSAEDTFAPVEVTVAPIRLKP